MVHRVEIYKEINSGHCNWSVGEPICLEPGKKVLAKGCEYDECDGCSVSDWFFENETECTNFNNEGSECYRLVLSKYFPKILLKS